MKDRLRAKLWETLRFLLMRLAPPESYASMRARHEWEIEIYQNHCKHKETRLDYIPLVTCSICHKVLRKATEEELAEEKDRLLRSLNEEVKQVEVERLKVKTGN